MKTWSAGDKVWVPAGNGWRPGVVKSESASGLVYVKTWTQRGKVPSNTKPPAKTQVSCRGANELCERDESGMRPEGRP